LNQLDKAEADFNKAIALKPTEIDFLLERGQLYERLGKQEKAAADFLAAFEAKKKAIVSARATFDKEPHVRANRMALSKAMFSLGESYRKAGKPAEAASLALERAALWPTNVELYNVACELALCIPLVGKEKERTPAEEAQRRQLGDQAMDLLKRSIFAG